MKLKWFRVSLMIVAAMLLACGLISCSKKGGGDTSANEEIKGISANHTDDFHKINRKEFDYQGEEETTDINVVPTTEESKYIIDDAPENPEDVIVGEIKDNFISIGEYSEASKDTPENEDRTKFGNEIAGFFQAVDEDKVTQLYNTFDTIFTEHSDWDPRVFKRVKGVENTEDYMWTIYTLSNGPTNIKIAVGESIKYKVENN